MKNSKVALITLATLIFPVAMSASSPILPPAQPPTSRGRGVAFNSPILPPALPPTGRGRGIA